MKDPKGTIRNAIEDNILIGFALLVLLILVIAFLVRRRQLKGRMISPSTMGEPSKLDPKSRRFSPSAVSSYTSGRSSRADYSTRISKFSTTMAPSRSTGESVGQSGSSTSTAPKSAVSKPSAKYTKSEIRDMVNE